MESCNVIIAFCGFEGSGKNYTAKLLQEKGFLSVSFAENLKRSLAIIFGWDYSLLEGITPESREWRELIDEFWSKELDKPKLTPRNALQEVGTNVMRNNYHTNIWVSSLKKKLSMLPKHAKIVITDCRYPSEADTILDWGGYVIRIERESAKPKWYEDFMSSNLSPEEYYLKTGVHTSETSLLRYENYSARISNNGTLDELKSELDNFLLSKRLDTKIPTLAFDFDDVILPFMPFFVLFYNRTRKDKLHLEDFEENDIAKTLNVTKEEAHALFNEFIDSEEHDIMHRVSLAESCLNACNQLALKYRLIIVTAREKRFETLTKNYLTKHFGDIFSSIHFCSHYGENCVTKLEVCKEMDCFALIDDNTIHLKDLEAHGIKPIAFGNYSWNRKWKGKRIESWEDMSKHFS